MREDGRKETCRCGHDKDTHYREQGRGVPYACLAFACPCASYRDAAERPEVLPATRRQGAR